MGVEVSEIAAGKIVRVQGVGLDGLQEPTGILDCGNSGTTMRLMLGLLAGREGRHFVLDGDQSLRKRPMGRVVQPLSKMEASITGRQGETWLPWQLMEKHYLGQPFTLLWPALKLKVQFC